MTPQPPELRYAILELGLRCNLRCDHCASGSGRPRPGELDLSRWLQVVDDLAALGCGAVDLMGGEVLLSRLLDPVGEALRRAGLGWGILSNGWLLDHARAQALLELGCRGVGISLDGAGAATHDLMRGRAGAFERAMAALGVVASLPLRPRNRAVLTSVNQRNVAELPAMGRLLSRRFPGFRWSLNLCSAEAPRLQDQVRLGPEGRQRVLDFVARARARGTYDLQISLGHDVGYQVGAGELHDHTWEGCPAGIHNLGIQSDGQVKGCLALAGSHAVGNVKDTSLRELWQDPEPWRAQREFSTDQLGPNCRSCVFGARCRGGCMAYSTAHTGVAHNHPHCLWRTATADQRRAVQVPAIQDSATDERWDLPLTSTCIELTLRCNLGCIHCGSAAGKGRRELLDLAAFVPLFRDLYLLGGERIVLLGGEPLLHPDWDSVTLMAAGFDLEVALITNGTLVTPAMARKMAGLPLTHVGVSIDGAEDRTHDRIRGVPGARRKAWDAVRRLQDVGMPVTVITTLNQLNIGELEPMRDQLLDRGLVWQIQAANGTGGRFRSRWMLEPGGILQAARFIQQTRQVLTTGELALAGGHNIGHHGCSVSDHGTTGAWQGCPGGVTAAGICADGSVKGCLSMDAQEVVGNIHRTTLKEIWERPEPFAHRRWSSPGDLTGGCARCPHGSTCRAGCPQMARAATGHGRDNPFCIRQAEQAEEAVA